MMVTTWLANNRGPLCGEETWPLHIDIPTSDGDPDVRQHQGIRPGLVMLADPLANLRADIHQVFARNP